MDSFEINKIVAAVLMVALLVIGIGKLSDVIFHVEKPEKPGYAVDVEEATTVSTSTKASVEEKVDIAALMAMGDVTIGEKVFKKTFKMKISSKFKQNPIFKKTLFLKQKHFHGYLKN